MEFTAHQIATLIDGKIIGNPETKVTRAAKIEEAQNGDLSFIANPKYEHYLYNTNASLIIVQDTLQIEKPINATLIQVKDAYSGFAKILEAYYEIIAQNKKKGIENPAYISESAQLGENVYIGAFSYIGDHSKIADNVRIYPGSYIGCEVTIAEGTVINAGAKIGDYCKIGKNVIIHSGVVIGGDGFGFAPKKDGSYQKVPQIGNVIIEDEVEIGVNTAIDRATMGSTIIRKGVKLDNLIQIAHNVEIGDNTVIAAQTGISGSTKLGKNCILGGQIGVVGHLQIANGTQINAQSGLSKSVSEENTALGGSPAFDYKTSLKSQAIYRNLPELVQRIQQLELALKALTEQNKITQ